MSVMSFSRQRCDRKTHTIINLMNNSIKSSSSSSSNGIGGGEAKASSFLYYRSWICAYFCLCRQCKIHPHGAVTLAQRLVRATSLGPALARGQFRGENEVAGPPKSGAGCPPRMPVLLSVKSLLLIIPGLNSAFIALDMPSPEPSRERCARDHPRRLELCGSLCC